MLRATLTALSLVAAASAGYTPLFYQTSAPQFYAYTNQMVAAPVTDPGRNGVDLPCYSEGFFSHPSDCSRFYRCVDYAATGQFFSRFEFQCPAGQMFLAVGKYTCVPGNCPGVVPLPTPPPAGAATAGGWYPQGGSQDAPTAPAPVSEIGGGAYPAPGGVPPSPQIVGTIGTSGSAYPQGGQSGSVAAGPGSQVGGGAYPAAGGAAVAGATAPVAAATAPVASGYPGSGAAPTGSQVGGGAYPAAGGAAGAGATAGSGYPGSGGAASVDTSACPARYVQDPMYCNIYLPCPGNGNRYVCSAGSVFDQDRQMCRLNSRAEDMCAGKSVYDPATFRSGFLFQQPTSIYQPSQQFYSFNPVFPQGQQFYSSPSPSQQITYYNAPQAANTFTYSSQISPMQPQSNSLVSYVNPQVAYYY